MKRRNISIDKHNFPNCMKECVSPNAEIYEMTQELAPSSLATPPLSCLFSTPSPDSIDPNTGKSRSSVSGSAVAGVDLAVGEGEKRRSCSCCDCIDSKNGRYPGLRK